MPPDETTAFSVASLPGSPQPPVRRLVFVLGDQLDAQSAPFDDFDPAADAVFMAEVRSESTVVWSARPRTAMFLAAMRHFAHELQERGIRVFYSRLDDADNTQSLEGELDRAVTLLKPGRVDVVQPGEWRLDAWLRARQDTVVHADRHFLCTTEQFSAHARGRKQLRLEFFYREMRERHGVLLEQGNPAGGRWNFDAENRGSFGKSGPSSVPAPWSTEPDEITAQVLALVDRSYGDHPGALHRFDWPVTRTQALTALDEFIGKALPQFGEFQDAMWTNEPWLYHSRLSAALNLKLLRPLEVIRAAEGAWQRGAVPLAAAEGFIRQILGWREYVRGIYWHFMPGYVERNALDANEPLPAFYWSGDVPMQCLRSAIGQTLELGYAHHIQRLMVTGLYALLVGVDPRAVHEWYLAVYVDAVEWVELPNTLGMSQYADGGVMASKPYVATGKYIQRMSNYCEGCRFRPDVMIGPRACPFTTLYWDFLGRHESSLARNPRMALQVRNLARLDEQTRKAIAASASAIRANGGIPPEAS
jgi:deoxyribodipyrimidine photolyase-related protein